MISNQASQDYSEWFLGHTKSPYYTYKELVRREIYAIKCMKDLTFLDYSVLEARGRGTKAGLQEKTKEIQALQDRIARMEESQLRIIEFFIIFSSSFSKIFKKTLFTHDISRLYLKIRIIPLSLVAR